MTPFRERNPIPIALIGFAVILGLLLLAFNIRHIPGVVSQHTYKATFADSTGLKSGDRVRIAGVRVGNVNSVKLSHGHVLVTFSVDSGQRLGINTTAAIKLETLLGTKYVDVVPAGPGHLKGTIPLDRTSVPFEVYKAFGQLATTTESINLNEVAKAFNTIADTFKNTPSVNGAAIRGLAKFSQSIAGRDTQFSQLLQSTNTVTQVLASRDAQLVKLMGDADLVLQVVEQRRQAIQNLLRDSAALGTQLTSLIRADRSQIDPVLFHLHTVADLLGSNLKQLDQIAALVGPFGRYAANVQGNGRFIDVYDQNLVVSDAFMCSVHALSGCTG